MTVNFPDLGGFGYKDVALLENNQDINEIIYSNKTDLGDIQNVCELLNIANAMDPSSTPPIDMLTFSGEDKILNKHNFNFTDNKFKAFVFQLLLNPNLKCSNRLTNCFIKAYNNGIARWGSKTKIIEEDDSDGDVILEQILAIINGTKYNQMGVMDKPKIVKDIIKKEYETINTMDRSVLFVNEPADLNKDEEQIKEQIKEQKNDIANYVRLKLVVNEYTEYVYINLNDWSISSITNCISIFLGIFHNGKRLSFNDLDSINKLGLDYKKNTIKLINTLFNGNIDGVITNENININELDKIVKKKIIKR